MDDADALEDEKPFSDHSAEGRFRGSFSGFERDRLFYNPEGRGRFFEAGYVMGLDFIHDGRAATPVDVDGDGDLDLAILGLQGLRLVENVAPARRFARLRLQATRTQAHALGARVALTCGDRTQRDYVRITEGFQSQVPFDLHFGLGDAERIDELVVHWPSGETDRWTDLPVDRLLLVLEDSPNVAPMPLPRWPDEARPDLPQATSSALMAKRLDGPRERLAPLGRPAVVNFWAPWCAPCRAELPELGELSQRLGDEVSFAGVSVETEDLASVREAVRAHGLDYRQYLADEDLMESFFGAAGQAPLPSTFVFDGSGELRRVFRRPIGAEDLEGILVSLREEEIFVADLTILARRSARLGDDEKAVDAYRRLIAAQPQRPRPHFDLGLTLRRLGRHAEAHGAFEDAARLMPEEPRVWLFHGIAAADAGYTQEAVEALARAVSLEPGLVEAWTIKARAHIRLDQLEQARACLERALELDPEAPGAREELQSLDTNE